MSLAFLLLALDDARALEADWSGHYRARGLLYDSLSLSQSNDLEEGTSAFTDHRLRLTPSFHASSRVSVHAQLDALPLAPWGAPSATWYDPVTGENIPLAYAHGVTPFEIDEDGVANNQSVQVTRAWADVYTDIGRLRFGRVPMNWGAGILFNDGLEATDEFGDSSDRFQLTTRAGPIYLMTGWEGLYEGYLGVPDDMQAADLAIMYKAETTGIGLFNRYRFQPSSDFKSYTGDLWGEALLGPIHIELELAGIFGRGDLDTGANDISIAAGGGLLAASLDWNAWLGGLEGGFATGDEDPDDARLTTFTFDRDHNVALMMFEEPMPLLEAQVINETNGGREFGAVRTGEGIRNALYLNPWVGYQLHQSWQVSLHGLFAKAAKLPEGEATGYGTEIDAQVRWLPHEHFYLEGTAGLFLPGSYYSSYEHPELGGGFEDPAWGGRLYAVVEF